VAMGSALPVARSSSCAWARLRATTVDGVAVQDRLCRICGDASVEDERHFLAMASSPSLSSVDVVGPSSLVRWSCGVGVKVSARSIRSTGRSASVIRHRCRVHVVD
ncbi:MAG: hypothetical protein P4L81_07710, partial [Candidatus Pacebacteria bacterium]|nr:hypothetical protein [Candidatus Paceibacterota bacterium]